MTERDLARKLNQVEYLLNDPEAPMRPGEVWALLAEIARHDLTATEPGGEA